MSVNSQIDAKKNSHLTSSSSLRKHLSERDFGKKHQKILSIQQILLEGRKKKVEQIPNSSNFIFFLKLKMIGILRYIGIQHREVQKMIHEDAHNLLILLSNKIRKFQNQYIKKFTIEVQQKQILQIRVQELKANIFILQKELCISNSQKQKMTKQKMVEIKKYTNKISQLDKQKNELQEKLFQFTQMKNESEKTLKGQKFKSQKLLLQSKTNEQTIKTLEKKNRDQQMILEQEQKSIKSIKSQILHKYSQNSQNISTIHKLQYQLQEKQQAISKYIHEQKPNFIKQLQINHKSIQCLNKQNMELLQQNKTLKNEREIYLKMLKNLEKKQESIEVHLQQEEIKVNKYVALFEQSITKIECLKDEIYSFKQLVKRSEKKIEKQMQSISLKYQQQVELLKEQNRLLLMQLNMQKQDNQ